MAALMLMIITAPWLAACQTEGGEESCADGQAVVGGRYLNLTVTVSRGHVMTRAGELPAWGEDGDGREAGLEREGRVSGITVILYQADGVDGINTAGNPVIDFAAYYTTALVSRSNTGELEEVYTTGDREVNSSMVDLNRAYHAVIVANRDLTTSVKAGETRLNDVRDMVLRENIYTPGAVGEATDFVMSSEADCELSPANATIDTSDPQRTCYRYKDIRIERLAARMDFWAAGSNAYSTGYDRPGYEYTVTDDDGNATADRFVVTGITPFNMNHYDGGNGGTYLLKRLTDKIEAGYTVTYLADETGGNYVVDPTTTTKGSSGTMTFFINKLQDMNPATAETHSGNALYRSVESMYGNAGEFYHLDDAGRGGDNMIIAYTLENTLWEASSLYGYATGMAIEGDYYRDGDVGKRQHKVFYGYLRHNGSLAEAYRAMGGGELSLTETCGKSNAMEFGIVRNNIYRVFISHINKEETGDVTLTLAVKVKKWDCFRHKVIYM